MKKGVIGTVYLIHFERAFHHARHYIGWTTNDSRIQRHIDGHGSKLLRAVANAGIAFHVVREWHGVDRHFERKLKNMKKSRALCPQCKGETCQVNST